MPCQITEEKIKHIAQEISKVTLYRLRAGTNRAEPLPLDIAVEVAKDAGDKFAQALDLALREHNIEILK